MKPNEKQPPRHLLLKTKEAKSVASGLQIKRANTPTVIYFSLYFYLIY